MNRNTVEALIIATVATGLSYVVALTAGWVDTLNPVELVAVFTAYVSTYLCVKERRINYLFGAISTAAYVILFYQQGLVASMILNIYLTPSLLYGWFRWRNDATTRPVTRVRLKWVPVYLGATALAYWGASALANHFGGAMVATDALILIGTVLAQFLLDNKKVENWIIWAVVNVFAIYTYYNAGLYLAAFQYVLFLFNTVYGFTTWIGSYKNGARIRTADGITPNAGASSPL